MELISSHLEALYAFLEANKAIDQFPIRSVKAPAGLCEKIVAYCAKSGYPLDGSSGAKNLIYVEGANIDAQLNDDALDVFNDLRLVITPLEGDPGAFEIIYIGIATTTPGRYYTRNPINRKGAARIALGKQTAWRMGLHKQKQPALVQAAPVVVHRDLNKDGSRKGDKLDTGWFGINHHTTDMDFDSVLVGQNSAGCCVGKYYFEHLLFLWIMSTDPRYQSNRDFIFSSTVIPGDKL